MPRTAQSDTLSESTLDVGGWERASGTALAPNLHLKVYHRDVTGGICRKLSRFHERQMQKIQKMTRSKVQNMLMPDLEQTSLRERRLHHTCLRRGVPADNEVQSQIRKDGYPHLVETSSTRKTVPQNSQRGDARVRKSHQNT